MKMSRLSSPCRGVLGVLFVAQSAACIGSTEPDPYDPEVIEEVVFDSSLGINLDQMTETQSGVYIQDLVAGEGTEVEVGTTYTADYTGWLSNGYQFEAGSLDETPEGQPYAIGFNQLIPGLELGMLGMRAGGTRRIIIPPDLAYGRYGAGVIPAGAILIFIVVMLTAS
jgi:FKBP-type peptidyl-prolyl cis-trans isomerase FkpA